MATLIKADGTRETVTPANGESFTIEELYAHLAYGCDYVQTLPGPRGLTAVLDEEAKTSRHPAPPVNYAATTEMQGYLLPGDEIWGNLLLVTDAEMGD